MPPSFLRFYGFLSVLFHGSFQSPGGHGHGSTKMTYTDLRHNRTSSAQAAVSRALEVIIVGKNHCTHALIVNVRISVNRLYHEAQGDYTFSC